MGNFHFHFVHLELRRIIIVDTMNNLQSIEIMSREIPLNKSFSFFSLRPLGSNQSFLCVLMVQILSVNIFQ